MNNRKNLDLAILAAGLLAICGLSYGLTAGKLGFFLDDWYIIWTYRTFGAAKFVDFFRGDRPLFSYVYRVFIPIFKDSPIAWQVFAIFTKWLSGIALWALLKLFLPRRNWFAYAVAALFLVYPGFKFHYFSVMYSQGYALFAIYLLSHIFMVLALRNPNRRILLTGAAMVCQFIGIAPQEYYYGLELVRPVLLYLALPEESKNMKTRLLMTLKFWLPYIFVLVGFTIFRVFMSNLYSYQLGFLDTLKYAPFEAIFNLIRGMAKGLFESCVTVWVELLSSLINTEGLRELLPRTILIVVAFLLSYFFLGQTDQRAQDFVSEKKSAILMGVLGLYIVLVGMIPFLVAGFEVGVLFPNNRFLLPLSIGVSLVVASLVDLLLRNNTIKCVLIALIIGFSVEANHSNGLVFQKAWEDQKNFFTQLAWRAPQIMPGTVVITTSLPFELYFSGGSLTAPLNMIYAPELQDNPIPYQVILAGSIQMNSMPELIPNQPIDRFSRVFRFIGNTSNMITLYMPVQGCLKVISPDTDPKSFQNDRYPDIWGDLIQLSNLSRIDTKAPNAVLPSRYFGEVSTNTWCYYYQQAAIIEQKAEWAQVVAVYTKAKADGFNPQDSSEWLPLINAKIQLNEISTALELSDDIEVADDFTFRGLCSFWQKKELSLTAPEREMLEILLEQWQCEVK